MASSSAVRPRAAVYINRFCNSSTLEVKLLISSARSLKLTRKNSSCGLAVLKNCTAARRALSTLLDMLPLMSKITPMEMGTSSLEAGYQAIKGISHRDIYQHQVYVHTDRAVGALGFVSREFPGVIRGNRWARFLTDGRRGNQGAGDQQTPQGAKLAKVCFHRSS